MDDPTNNLMINNNQMIDPFSQSQLTRQLQNIMQIHMIRNITTGNFIIDTIIQIVMMAFITYCITQIKTILDKISLFFYNIYNYIYRKGKYYLCKMLGYKNKFTKTVDITYISDNRQINELYKAIYWYLSSTVDVDYIRETNLQYVYDKKIDTGFKLTDFKINKILNQNRSKDIMYKTNKIYFLFDTETIVIYTDKEKKRDNYKITLWTEIDEYSNIDILEDFCKMCVSKYVESLTTSEWKQKIYTNKEDRWDEQESKNGRKLETVVLQDNIKNKIKKDMEVFIDSEDWYMHRDIPYTRGYLFYGLPGTGKTSLIKSLSLNFKRHIHFLMLQNINSDNQLLELLKNINYKDTILVIEDIDATLSIVKSRDTSDNHTKKKDKKIEQLTLSGLLNALDGVFNNHGRIMIMTTNHPEVLDSALIRAGRVDIKYQFNNCSKEQIKELYNIFFDKILEDDKMYHIKNEYSPAHITSVFMRYRNDSDIVLEHLDDIEQKIVIK